MSRSKNFIFTWNNPPLECKEILSTYGAKYLAYSHEIAPTIGTPHLQGFVCFPNARFFSAVCKQFKGCHLEVMKGDLNQNADYCSKSSELIELGEKPKSRAEAGETNKERWKSARALACAGTPDLIMDDELYSRYYSTWKKMAADHMPAPQTLSVLQNEWNWGSTGTGKSKSARDRFPDAYIKDPKEKWWDGYAGQETVIIDDFDVFQKALGGDMKRWCDHYPFPAQVKGGTMLIRPKRIIVTSNYSPEEIWDDRATLEPINRRFIVNHVGPCNPPFASIFNKV